MYAADMFRPKNMSVTDMFRPPFSVTRCNFVLSDSGFCSLGFVGIDSFCLSRSGLTPNEDFLGTPKQSKRCER